MRVRSPRSANTRLIRGFGEFLRVLLPREAALTTQFVLRATYLDVAHESSDADVKFYKSLEHAEFKLVDVESGQPVQPVPGPKQTALAIVTAVVSSTALSQAVEAWLRTEPARIEVTVEQNNTKRTVVFEGPDIKESRDDIDRLLHELSAGSEQCKAELTATKKNL